MSWNQGGGGGGGLGRGGGWRSGRTVGQRRARLSAAQFRGIRCASCRISCKRWLPGGGAGLGGGRGWILGFVVIVVLWLLSAASIASSPTSKASCCASAPIDRTATPGLNYHLPSPIEEALTPKVTRVNRIEIGFAPTRRSRRDHARCRKNR